MAIEWVWFFNAWMDFLLLWACGRMALRKISASGLFAAAALGGFLAAVSVCPGVTFLQHPIFALAWEPLLLRCAFGRMSGRSFLRLLGLFTGLCVLCGGIGHMLCSLGFGGRFASLSAAAGLCVCGVGRRVPVPRNFQACLTIRSVAFCALLDSGNTLREPLSGLPVAVGSPRIREYCDPDICRRIAVRTVFGTRHCPVYALRGAVVDFSGGRVTVPWLWVLIQEEPLPDGIDVILAPCICWEGYDDRDMDLRSA